MDNPKLRDYPLVLGRAFIAACEYEELEEVRWMLQYRELARDIRIIDIAIRKACESCHLAVVRNVVEHIDDDVNINNKRKGTMLHGIYMD
jgi:hypothetical protein